MLKIKMASTLLDAFVVIPFLFGIGLNFTNVVGRYVFGSTIIWADEVLIYVVAWIVFYGAGLVSIKGGHLSIDFISTIVNTRVKVVLRVTTLVITLLACMFVLNSSKDMLSVLARSGQKSIAAGIPMVIPHAAIPLGFAIILIVSLAALMRKNTYKTLAASKYGSA